MNVFRIRNITENYQPKSTKTVKKFKSRVLMENNKYGCFYKTK